MKILRRLLGVLPLAVAISFIPVAAISAQAGWSKQCPTIVDLQSSQPQPLVTRFTFTGTSQLFLRIEDGTERQVIQESPLIGCYADFSGLNSSTPNGYHVGAINRDGQGFYWINASGVSWRLSLDSSGDYLTTDTQNPYFNFGNKFLLRVPFGLNPMVSGAFGMSADPLSSIDKRAWIGTQEFPVPASENSFGFSYYTNVWPMFNETIKGISASAGVTWIYPRMQELSIQKRLELCPVALDGLQSMEGGLAWAHDQFRFSTLLPKYKLNPVADCYSSNAPTTPFWDFIGGELPEGKISTLLISNRILVPPDGFTFSEESAGGMLGVATMSQPFRPLISATDQQSGEQSWMVFFNTSKFKGPIALYPPQLWSTAGLSNPLKKQFTFDRSGAYLTGAALEWGGVPFVEYRDNSSNIFSKIPGLQFPSDSNGETVVMSDFRAYSKQGWYSQFKDFIDGKSEAPSAFPTGSFQRISMKSPSFPLYQSGDLINPFPQGRLSELQSGNAFGFVWKEKNAVIKPSSIFKKVGNSRIPVDPSEVPSELQNYSFQEPKNSTFRYETPSWWKNDSTNQVFQAHLNDGSTVSYTWVKFIDQPGIKGLILSDAEKVKVQAIAVQIQKKWNDNPEFIDKPTKGNLASLDGALFVNPPSGKEFGYVPLVLSQVGTNKSQKDAGILLSSESAFQSLLESDRKAELINIENKASAEKVAAELKAKQEAEAATAKAEVEAARILAETKAAADKAAADKAKASSVKKTTIICIKGKLTKRVTAINPKCPSGYKKK